MIIERKMCMKTYTFSILTSTTLCHYIVPQQLPFDFKNVSNLDLIKTSVIYIKIKYCTKYPRAMLGHAGWHCLS